MSWLLGFGIPIVWLAIGMPLARRVYVDNYVDHSEWQEWSRFADRCFHHTYSTEHQRKCLDGKLTSGVLLATMWGLALLGPLGIIGASLGVWLRWYLNKPINKKKQAKRKAQEELDNLTEILKSGIKDLKDRTILEAARDNLKKLVKDM